ncbi:MAG: hypothetical protein EHM13_13280 [Acidobacteria bacterium]|nr:MAG: hypothetical protein EHM13_13280 [Acidobacteriota bacterium]
MGDDLRATIAQHEAAHAVMRWLLGLPATALSVQDGGGVCEGTGRREPAGDVLMVFLAGYAPEADYTAFGVPDLSPQDTRDVYDIKCAREILTGRPWLCYRAGDRDREPTPLSVDEALCYHFERAAEILFDYCELIEFLGMRLDEAGALSARRVAATFREYRKAIEREQQRGQP